MDAQHRVHHNIERLEYEYDPENDGLLSNFTDTDMSLLIIIKDLQTQIEELAARIYMLESGNAEEEKDYT